jgi:hypothetical protein
MFVFRCCFVLCRLRPLRRAESLVQESPIGCLNDKIKAKAVPLHATITLGGRGGIAPTHSRPRH